MASWCAHICHNKLPGRSPKAYLLPDKDFELFKSTSNPTPSATATISKPMTTIKNQKHRSRMSHIILSCLVPAFLIPLTQCYLGKFDLSSDHFSLLRNVYYDFLQFLET